MNWITTPETWIAIATLTAMEIVLGIDNVIFISILAGKLPKPQQKKARLIGLALTMCLRIVLLFSLAALMHLTDPIVTLFEKGLSGRDLILMIGGLFLLGKSTLEIHEKLEGDTHRVSSAEKGTVLGVMIQILLLDIVFSIDSIITAIGMVDQMGVMISAVIISVLFMMVFSDAISAFIDQHPTLKMLALSFLMLIGVMLIGDSLQMHVPKGYVYFAMAFSVFVEMLNLKARGKQPAPVKLRRPIA